MLIVFIVCSVMHTMLFNGNGLFLAGDGATRRGEGCSEIERPLARFKLERTHQQKKPYIAKRASWCRHSQSLSERLIL